MMKSYSSCWIDDMMGCVDEVVVEALMSDGSWSSSEYIAETREIDNASDTQPSEQM